TASSRPGLRRSHFSPRWPAFSLRLRAICDYEILPLSPIPKVVLDAFRGIGPRVRNETGGKNCVESGEVQRVHGRCSRLQQSLRTHQEEPHSCFYRPAEAEALPEHSHAPASDRERVEESPR